jgi:hypothetical protein
MRDCSFRTRDGHWNWNRNRIECNERGYERHGFDDGLADTYSRTYRDGCVFGNDNGNEYYVCWEADGCLRCWDGGFVGCVAGGLFYAVIRCPWVRAVCIHRGGLLKLAPTKLERRVSRGKGCGL